MALALTACASGPQAPGDVAASAPKADVPTGSTKGNATVHSAQSLKAAVDNAWVSLPASVTGGAVFNGLLKDAPRVVGKAPVVVFVHGSSGVAPAIKEWQKWLATDLGVASLSADSMQLPDRMTYKSPIAKAQYGDFNLWPLIYDLNKAKIGPNPNRLKPGTDLLLLQLTAYSQSDLADARRRAPSWKQYH